MDDLTQPRRIDSVESLVVLATAAAQAETWFRGHGDAAWHLRPKTHRPEFAGAMNEHMMMQQFRSQAGPVMAKPPSMGDHLDWLGVMQHYGLPTRMLDWTRSPLVAAFFGVWEKKHDAKDGCIWFIVPTAMNAALGGNRVRPGRGDPLLDQVCANAFYMPAKRQQAEPSCVAINSIHTDSRQMLQQGEFTVHDDPRALEDFDNAGEFCARYLIPSESKKRLRLELRALGANRHSLFPDLSSIAESIADSVRDPLHEQIRPVIQEMKTEQRRRQAMSQILDSVQMRLAEGGGTEDGEPQSKSD